MLPFHESIVLENERVKLNPLKIEDFDLLLPFSLEEPELWQFSLMQAGGEENLKKYLQAAINSRAKKTAYPFLVFDKKTKKIAGSTRFYDYNEHHQTVQIGYTWYGKKFQGTGLNKNCKLLLLEYAFERLKVQRVEFRADATNAKSIAAMKSIGCTVEGILRSNCKAKIGRRDSIILSILKDEWFNFVKENLLKKLT